MRHQPHKPSSVTPVGDSSEVAAVRRQIRQFARNIAAQFQPDQIILFGSHAYGVPHADSDVDLLVVMPTRNPIGQAVKIRLALPAPFSLDLLVRSPEMLAKRIEQEDWFLSEIVSKGEVLYEKDDGSVGTKGRSRLPIGQLNRSRGRALP